MADEKASAVSLVELLRAVPWGAVWRTSTLNGLGFMDTHSIPVGQLCYAAAEALSKPAANTKPAKLSGYKGSVLCSDATGHVLHVEFARNMAERFHEAYERLAPSFGYETRPETRAFDPQSANGKLMIAVCQEFLESMRDAASVAEECARLCDEVEERPWFGYESPNTFDDAKRACAAVIRAYAQRLKEGK